MTTISTRAQDVLARRPQGLIGMLAESSSLDRKRTIINSGGAVAQVTTITVSGATNSATYTITINGVDVSYTADSSTSTSEIAAGLVSAVNAEPLVRGQVAATQSTADIILTATNPGTAYTFTVTESESDLDTPVATTAAADAEAVGFGLAIVQTGNAADPTEANQIGRIANNAAFSAQVDTWTITYVASARVGLSVTYRGVTYKAETISATARADTMTALALALNAILPANTVVAAGTATGVTLTAEVVGEQFTSGFHISDEGASDPTGTLSSNKGVATSFALAFAGVSMAAYDEESTTVGSSTPSYPALSGVKVLEKGRIFVASAQSISFGEPVYVELDSGSADKGKFYNTASSTRALLPAARWERDSTDSTIAVLYVDADAARAA